MGQFLVVDPSAVGTVRSPDARVYPNPANESLMIPPMHGDWTVFNGQGQVMAFGSNNQAPLVLTTALWPNGLYFLTSSTAKATFVIQH